MHSFLRPAPRAEDQNLGYSGVVERADSVDFSKVDADLQDLAARRGASAQALRSAHQPLVLQGAAVPKQPSPSKRGQIAKGLSLTSRSITLQTRPSGSGPALAGSPFGPPLGPNLGGQKRDGASSRPGSASASMHARQKANDDWCRGEIVMQGSGMASPEKNRAIRPVSAGSVQEELVEKQAQIDELNHLLRKQAEEKREIEMGRFKLAAENINLRQELDLVKTRQRPWSASSAGRQGSSRHDQQRHQDIIRAAKGVGGMQAIQEKALPSALQQQTHREGVVDKWTKPSAGRHRPASASVASRNNYLIPHSSQGAVRRHPVFGQDSLMHRIEWKPNKQDHVSTPEQGGGMHLSIGARPDPAISGLSADATSVHVSSSPKDDLFVRPDAQKGVYSVQAAGLRPGFSATRSRPQSANAATRHISSRHVSAQQRPGSARLPRPGSAFADRLIHADADDFVRFHMPLPSEEATQRVIAILWFMRSAADKKHIRVMDFMQSFDKLKRGHVSCNEFRRALESCACFGDMSEDAYNLVYSFFLHEQDSTRDVLSPMSRISYAAFCEVLQPVGDKRVKLNVDQQVLKDLGKQKKGAKDSALASNELSQDGETKVSSLIKRIVETIQQTRLPMRDFLRRLDSRSGSNGNGGPTSPTVNTGTGCISRSQYLRGIRNANIGMHFSDEDLALLFRKYERHGEFNYFCFCRDMEAAEKR